MKLPGKALRFKESYYFDVDSGEPYTYFQVLPEGQHILSQEHSAYAEFPTLTYPKSWVDIHMPGPDLTDLLIDDLYNL